MLSARRGQGAMEYVMMLAGALLIVVLSIAIFQQLQGRSAKQIEAGVEKHAQLVCAPQYDVNPQITVLAWKMHEGSGTTAFDTSPNKAHGTINPGIPWLVDPNRCKNLNCLFFDRDGSVESQKPVSLASGGVTIELWFTPNAGGEQRKQPIRVSVRPEPQVRDGPGAGRHAPERVVRPAFLLS